MKREYHVVSRGFNGWNAKGINVTSSGGSLEGHTHWTGEKVEGYLASAIDGALVYDAAHLEDTPAADFINLIISGPMCDPGLGIAEVSRFGDKDKESLARMKPLLGGAFRRLAEVVEQNPKFTGLDRVGVGIYKELLKAIPGMKIGHVLNGKVVWE